MKKDKLIRAPDKVLISIMPISSPNPMFDHLLESSHRDDSNKWSNIGFSEEIMKVQSIEVNFMLLIKSCVYGIHLIPFSALISEICHLDQ